jgi:integral membrane protein
VTDPLLRYRVLANVVGVVLIVLVCIAVPLRYLGDQPALSKAVSPVHGALYLLLVISVLLLGRDRRWTVGRTVLVALGGTVPFVSFLVERSVVRQESAARAV